MSGLTSSEHAKAMKEISMGKSVKDCSLNLKDSKKLKEFLALEREIKAIAKTGMVDLGSDWLGES